jgi:8-oxo-dGTP pyrophosphatase MutT (NUDIX family)
VIERLALPSEVELLRVERLRLTRVEAPLAADEQALIDRVWEDAVRAKPALFDGPIAASGGLYRDGPGALELRWVRATYRRYLGRDVPGATGWLPHLFAAVLQPTPDGALLVGQMAEWTSAPGRWQFPGGTVEPPPDLGGALGLGDLAELAARELWEETGTVTPPDRLRLWRLMRNPTGDVGAMFRAPVRSREALLAGYEALVAAEHAAGAQPELTRIAFVRDVAEVAALGGEASDYLMVALPALRR